MPYTFNAAAQRQLTASLALSFLAFAGCAGSTPLSPSVQNASYGPSNLVPNNLGNSYNFLAGAGGVPRIPKSAQTNVALSVDPAPTPFPLKFTTIDDPGSSTFNQAMGVDEYGEIVGNYGSGTPSDPSYGYEIQVPYTHFIPLNYPGAINSVVTSLSSTRLRAGYFLDATQQRHTWGFVKNRGSWTQYKDMKGRKVPHSVTELLGINGSDIAVGFYLDSHGNDQPFELTVQSGIFYPLRPPNTRSAQATGINLRGDVVGIETLTGGGTEGWLLRNGVYTQLKFPNSKSTQALGLNFSDQIVGSYVDNSGSTHGYILQHPTDVNNRVWQSVDYPDALGMTVVNGINTNHDFVGWFVDVLGVRHGFLAVAITGSDAHRQCARDRSYADFLEPQLVTKSGC